MTDYLEIVQEMKDHGIPLGRVFELLSMARAEPIRLSRLRREEMLELRTQLEEERQHCRRLKNAHLRAVKSLRFWRNNLPSGFYARMMATLADEQHPIQDPGPLYDWSEELFQPIREYEELEQEVERLKAELKAYEDFDLDSIIMPEPEVTEYLPVVPAKKTGIKKIRILRRQGRCLK